MPTGVYPRTEEHKKYCYQKGHVPWTKGKPRPEEVKKKISIALIGQPGRPHTAETKIKMSNGQRLEKNPAWRGGVSHDYVKGYILINMAEHPCCNKRGYVPEHRLVMEAHIGRTLLPTEIVHHINSNPSDNRIENLMLFSNNTEHLKYHHAIKRVDKQQRNNNV